MAAVPAGGGNVPFGDDDHLEVTSDEQEEVTTEPGPTRHAQKKEARKMHEEFRKAKRWQDCVSTLKIMMVVWVGLPCVILIWIVLCGSLLAAMEGWSFRDGFFYMGSPMSASLGGLSSRVPKHHGSRFFIIISCAWGLGIFACGSAMLATPIVAPLVRLVRLDVHASVEQESRASAKILLLVVFTGLPLFFLVISCVVGGIISVSEDGWDYYDGFRYTITMLSGVIDPEQKYPQSTFGKILGLLATSWGTGCSALVVSAIGCPFAGPLLRAIAGEDM